MMADDYAMKMLLVDELRDAVRIKRLNEELMEHLQSTILYILQYAKENKIPLSNLIVIAKAVERAEAMILLATNGNSTTENNNGRFNTTTFLVLLRLRVFREGCSGEVGRGVNPYQPTILTTPYTLYVSGSRYTTSTCSGTPGSE
ncbi:MAG: hypothetical protein ACREBU_18760 [Nitrososphaera sp.]